MHVFRHSSCCLDSQACSDQPEVSVPCSRQKGAGKHPKGSGSMNCLLHLAPTGLGQPGSLPGLQGLSAKPSTPAWPCVLTLLPAHCLGVWAPLAYPELWPQVTRPCLTSGKSVGRCTVHAGDMPDIKTPDVLHPSVLAQHQSYTEHCVRPKAP